MLLLLWCGGGGVDTGWTYQILLLSSLFFWNPRVLVLTSFTYCCRHCCCCGDTGCLLCMMGRLDEAANTRTAQQVEQNSPELVVLENKHVAPDFCDRWLGRWMKEYDIY